MRKEYYFTEDNDNTLKQLLDRFYLIPKEDIKDYSEDLINFLECNTIIPASESVKQGKNGYIIFRGKKNKKLSQVQQEEIESSNKSYRDLAKEYNVSAATISKVKNNKY